jgi:hypothetical protein
MLAADVSLDGADLMTPLRAVPPLMLLAVLAGCGPGPDSPAPPARSTFDAQLKAMEKAKGVEQVQEAGTEAKRQAIEEQTK